MSKYTNKDMVLLQEAYALTLLKEQAPSMTLNQIKSRLSLMSESELKYLITVQERILNEFWGGVKNLMGAGKNAANAVGNAAKSAVGAGVNAAKNVAGNVGNAVSSAAKGVGAAAGQMAGNVKDIYNAGNQSSAYDASIKQANDLIANLVALVQKYDPEVTEEDIMGTPLQQIIADLTVGKEDVSASTPSLTQGAGQAAQAGYQANRQLATA